MKIPQWMRGFAFAEEAPTAPSALALEHGATSQKNLVLLLEEEAEGVTQRELSCPGNVLRTVIESLEIPTLFLTQCFAAEQYICQFNLFKQVPWEDSKANPGGNY